jgi:hypothetical protein
VAGAAAQSSASACTVAIGSTTGSRPLRTQLLWKMAPKPGATMARMPNSFSVHTACSREEPQPKSLPASRIDAPVYAGWFSTNKGARLRSVPAR